MCDAVRRFDVRYVCGVFWQGKDDNTSLFKKLRACGGGLFFQPFWFEDPYERCTDAETAAVAARFDMMPDNVQFISVYPAYLLVLGPSEEVSKPHMSQQPGWDGKLFPCGSPIEAGLRALSDVPQLPEACELTRDNLPLKQATAPLWKWKEGVHQLLLWVGRNRHRGSKNRPSARGKSRPKIIKQRPGRGRRW